jgi:hypothetical protein
VGEPGCGAPRLARCVATVASNPLLSSRPKRPCRGEPGPMGLRVRTLRNGSRIALRASGMTDPNIDPPSPLPEPPALPEDFPFGSDKQPVGRTGRLSRFVRFVLRVLLLLSPPLVRRPPHRCVAPAAAAPSSQCRSLLRADDEAPPQRGMRRQDGSSASGRPERRVARARQARTASFPARAGRAMGSLLRMCGPARVSWRGVSARSQGGGVTFLPPDFSAANSDGWRRQGVG